MKRHLRVFTLLFFCLLESSFLFAKYGNPNAPKGGTFTYGIAAYPKSLQFYLAGEDQVKGISEYVFDSLVTMDPDTYEVLPLLAKSWKISKDKMTFTLTLDATAKFSDGTPVTAEDVKFTWDLIFNPKHQTVPAQSLFSSFEGIKVIDPTTVEFKAKINDYRNLEKLSEFFVLPKAVYSLGDYNRDYHEKLVGSGPYLLEEAKKGERIVFKRRTDYWAANHPVNQGRYNFDKLVLKNHEDDTVRYELLKKGDIDYFLFHQARVWANETDGPLFQNGYLKKYKVESKVPGSMSGIAWNLRKPLFQDVRVRKALSHLLNREKMIPELFYNQYVPVVNIIATNSEYHSPGVKPAPYDDKKAQQLLKEAGWNSLSEDGVLMKDGARFEFDLLLNQPAFQRILTGYIETLRKVGIKMNLRQMEWATSIKVRDEHQFDAFLVAYTRDVNPGSFRKMWGSEEADRKTSDNFTGYKNPKADKLYEKIDQEHDKKKRIKLVQELEKLIADDHPWTFFWELPYHRVAYWNKFSHPPGKPNAKFAIWRTAFDYWWLDPEKEKKLKAAKEKNEKVTF